MFPGGQAHQVSPPSITTLATLEACHAATRFRRVSHCQGGCSGDCRLGRGGGAPFARGLRLQFRLPARRRGQQVVQACDLRSVCVPRACRRALRACEPTPSGVLNPKALT